METYTSYAELVKPSWAPPASWFGPVWTLLYLIIIISFGTVLYDVSKKKLPKSFAYPFVLNIIFNLLFTPIQFGLKNNLLASVDILLVLGTLLWIFSLKSKLEKKKLGWVVTVNTPYLLWVLFATILQLTITYLNL